MRLGRCLAAGVHMSWHRQMIWSALQDRCIEA
jgi:hypothetical protein